MIQQKNLDRTKNSTFIILLPNSDLRTKGFPTPNGTGFFISKDGYFITARHVLKDKDNKLIDEKGIIFSKPEGHHISNIKIIHDWLNFDLALLKVDFADVKNKREFEHKDQFDYLDINFEIIPEGTDVYSFGYPLPKIKMDLSKPEISLGFHFISPRITSAIISSHYDVIGPVQTNSFPLHYVIDKALNYGNSGGPIVINESGDVISVCTRFQPVNIPQVTGENITVPSLYGISTSLKCIEKDLKHLL